MKTRRDFIKAGLAIGATLSLVNLERAFAGSPGPMFFDDLDIQGYLSIEAASFSSSTDLGAVSAKRVIYYYTGTGGHTFTLPAASGFGTGMQIIKNLSSGNLTVAAAANDMWFGGGSGAVSSVVLNPGYAIGVLGNGTYLYRIMYFAPVNSAPAVDDGGTPL